MLMSLPGLLLPGISRMEKINKKLTEKAESFSVPDCHLKHLLKQPGRFDSFSLGMDIFGSGGFFFDFSRQRMDSQALALLQDLAEATHALDRFAKMTRGDVVNLTENRAALHTAARGAGKDPLKVEAVDAARKMAGVQHDIIAFTEAVHAGTITAGNGRPFSHAVVMGIGGSYLGCEFVHEAMVSSVESKLDLHFLPNVDIDNFAGVIKKINPKTTLWIVISKSYTTTETMANLNQVLTFLHGYEIRPEDHLVTVTAKGSPGDNPDNPVLAAFHIFDFIGGRYSVSSAVGGLPLSLAFGHDIFKRFLGGCRAMDEHVLTAEPRENIPLTAALISVWNTIYLNYPAQAVIPYASRLSKLAPHVQQLYMESMGKSVSPDGHFLTRPAGAIIFGEPGTNAQHSFFQLAHQGPAFPIDFIGVITPGYSGRQALSKGVTNHQELWSNLLAQARALATGQGHDNPAQKFEGNRPSSIITVSNLEPESIGMILSFFEARTVLEGFILGINPFDQFGVELGKIMAGDMREEIAAKNRDGKYDFSHMGSAEQFYLNLLFKDD